jgi:hypothetical protein
MDELVVEPTGSADFGPCECCGNNSRRVWGFVHTPEASLASYFVHWTLTRVRDHGANFDLIIGRWGEGASAADRQRVALEYRLLESGPAFMVIDSGNRPAASSDLVGRVLARPEVIGQPIAKQAFAIVDAILAQDRRVAELLDG